MTEKKVVKMGCLEDLAIVVWHRSIVMKQKITVMCPDPDAFVPMMIELMSAARDLSRLKIEEFEKIFHITRMLKESEMALKKSDILAYEERN